jgi:hypothetical protein
MDGGVAQRILQIVDDYANFMAIIVFFLSPLLSSPLLIV